MIRVSSEVHMFCQNACTKTCIFQDHGMNQVTKQSLLSVTTKWPPLSGPSPEYCCADSKSSVPRDFNSNCAVSPSPVSPQSPAISRPSPKCNSADVKGSVPGDLNIDQAVPHNVSPQNTLPFQDHLQSITVSSQRAILGYLNNDCVESLPHCHCSAACHFKTIS